MIEVPKCYLRKCKHFIGVKADGDNEENERAYCEAFPDGIPASIAYGTNYHSKVMKAQKNAIIFEKNRS